MRVTLDQLDPAELPDLPTGLEPEGNGYRVSLIYARSEKALTRLADPAVLGLSTPAPPTALYELVDGAWKSVRYTQATADEGFTSVVELVQPGTFIAAYDPAAAAPAPAPDPPPAVSGPGSTPILAVLGGAGLLLLGTGFLGLRRRRARGRSTRSGAST